MSRKRSHLGTIAVMTMLAHAMSATAYADSDGMLPSRAGPASKPRGYGVHLSKAERRGKTFAELQAMREARKG